MALVGLIRAHRGIRDLITWSREDQSSTVWIRCSGFELGKSAFTAAVHVYAITPLCASCADSFCSILWILAQLNRRCIEDRQVVCLCHPMSTPRASRKSPPLPLRRRPRPHVTRCGAAAKPRGVWARRSPAARRRSANNDNDDDNNNSSNDDDDNDNHNDCRACGWGARRPAASTTWTRRTPATPAACTLPATPAVRLPAALATLAVIKGNHLSNTTCLTQVFF